jgi:Na+-driven multidrug efflux pump
MPIFTGDSFKEMGDTFKLGFQSIMLKVMGWWAFDVFTLLASQLDQRSIAAQTILRNIGLFTYMIPVGLSSAINFFTGKYIGKNRVDLAH